MLYGAAYYPEHRDPARWTHDLDRMVEARVNALRVGEFAWDRFEPAPGAYDFDWFDRWFDAARARRIGIVLCPPLRTPPAWLAQSTDDMAIVRDDGVRLAFGSRYSFCITHSELLDRAAALAGELARHYGPSDGVFGWHLDNEHGDEPDCHCPRCRALFAAWCRERYDDDLEKLNDAWGLDFWSLRFSSWDQIPTPAVSKTVHAPGHWLAWRRFRSEMTIRAARRQREAVAAHRGAGQFITTNFQVVHNPRTDYFDFARDLDVCGTNYYPQYGKLGEASLGLSHVRGYRAGANFHVFELRNGPHLIPGLDGNTPAPGEVARLAGLCVAHGAEGLFFFRWRACPFGAEQSHGTPTDYDGEPLAIHEEVAKVGRWLERVGPRLDATRVVADAAVLYDFPTRWSMEYPSPWNGPTGLYVESVRAAYAALRAAGLAADTTGRDADWSRYRLLLIPGLAAVDEALAGKIAAYVRAGGVVLAWPQTGQKDGESRYYPGRMPRTWTEVFGLRLADVWTGSEPVAVRDKDTGAVWGRARLFGERARLDGAQARAIYAEGPWANFPAVTEYEYGAGAAFAWMAYPDGEGLRVSLERAVTRAGVKRSGTGVSVPDDSGVEMMERRGGGERWVFVFNHSRTHVQATFPDGGVDTWNGDKPVNGPVELPAGGWCAVAYPTE